MPTLIRRELWEHRQLWIVPLAIAGMIVAAMMFPNADLHMDRADMAAPQKYMDLFALFHAALTIPQFLLLAVLLPYYLLDCLYAERKDRSILFWKALPVSDAQTVLSKLLVALVIVPLGVFALTLCSDIAASVILAVRLRGSDMLRMFLRWDTQVWLYTQGLILAALVMVMLWYAPVAAYLLLVSARAKRAVFLWAAMPPLVVMLIEKIAFGTTSVAKVLGYRLNGIWGALGFTSEAAHSEHAAGILDRVRPLAVLANIDLWLGLLVTVALVWLTIRIRRHQNEG